MKYAIKKTVLTGILIAVVHLIAGAQPIHHTGKEIEGILIYQDLLDDEKYYYAPNKLELAFNADGSPKFKYLKMANSVLNNTGTGGTLKDLSLIQLSLVKPSISREKLQLIKPRISDKEDLQLVPIPIDKMEFTLFAGNGSDANRQVIGSHLNASDQTNDNDLWEEKSLSIRLSKAGAAIVDQYIDEFARLGIYYSYSYFADFVVGMDQVALSGDQELSVPEIDTAIHKIAYQSEFLELKIDLAQWGDQCIEELVLNEAILPRYYPIQVFCYDFSDDLRPDLLLKKVKVCGDGLQGTESCLELSFSNQQRAQNAYSLRFKRPVLWEKPLRYQVTEISKLNGLKQGDWIKMEPGKSINISTAEKDRTFAQQVIEIEADFEEMRTLGFQVATIELKYQLNQKEIRKELSIRLNDTSNFLSTDFFYDKDTPVQYTTTWIGDLNEPQVDNVKILDGDFIYIKP